MSVIRDPRASVAQECRDHGSKEDAERHHRRAPNASYSLKSADILGRGDPEGALSTIVLAFIYTAALLAVKQQA
jgi:hypothetical protein